MKSRTLRARGTAQFEEAFSRRMLRLRKNGRAKRNILFKYARWSYSGKNGGKTLRQESRSS